MAEGAEVSVTVDPSSLTAEAGGSVAAGADVGSGSEEAPHAASANNARDMETMATEWPNTLRKVARI